MSPDLHSTWKSTRTPSSSMKHVRFISAFHVISLQCPFFHHAQALMVFLELYIYKKYIYMTLKLWSYLIGQSSVQRFLLYNPTALGLVMALVCLWWSWQTAVETKYFIPCWFCTFAHWQRNYQSRIVMVGLFEQRIQKQFQCKASWCPQLYIQYDYPKIKLR